MAINYIPQTMHDGVYGPNKVGDTYKPAPYHGVAAKRRKEKARWAHPSSCEYYVFNLADEHDDSIDENGMLYIHAEDEEGIAPSYDNRDQPLNWNIERKV